MRFSRIFWAAALAASSFSAPASCQMTAQEEVNRGRIRVDGFVQEARLTSRIDPKYPPLALQARIQGTVRLEALIGQDGTVKDLKVVSGHPLLVQAAMDAVKQWRYQPTLLNGEPIEVATTIDVPFTLSPSDPRATARAYAEWYVPGNESAENLRMAELAIEAFQKALQVDPDNGGITQVIANLYFSMKKFNEARQWYGKLVRLEPTNWAGYYSIGVTNWRQVNQARTKLLADLKLSSLRDHTAGLELCDKNLSRIEEGIQALNRAVELCRGYADATHLSLLYRERADCQPDPGLRAEYVKKADEWVSKSGEAKKRMALLEQIIKADPLPAAPGPPPDFCLDSMKFHEEAGSVPAAPGPPPFKRIRVGRQVQELKLLHKTDPIYPAIALKARIQGSVWLEALIGEDGTVKDLKVVSGHPLLLSAALDAVRQWRYQPTVLNGEPVEVATTIEVPFTR